MYYCILLYDINLVLLNKLFEVEGFEEKVVVYFVVCLVCSEVMNLKEYMYLVLFIDKFWEWVFCYFVGFLIVEVFSKEELVIIEGLWESKYNIICN